MSLVRITMPENMYLIDPVGIDLIAHLMNEYAKRYDCPGLVFNIHRRSEGMAQALVAKFDSSNRQHFAMGDYSYPYTYLEKFAEAVVVPYHLEGKFPGDNPAIYHNGEISFGMVLDAKQYELIIGLTAGGPAHHGYLACGCLAKLLLFVIETSQKKRRTAQLTPEKDQAVCDTLRSSVFDVWEFIVKAEGLLAAEVSSFIDAQIRENGTIDPTTLCLLDILKNGK